MFLLAQVLTNQHAHLSFDFPMFTYEIHNKGITGASHRFYKNITILACSARVASSTRTFEAVDSIPASSPVAAWIACAFVDIWNAIIGLGTYLLISCAFVVAQERQQKKK